MFSFFLDWRETEIATPTPAINTMTDVPPLEINGSGSPVGGMLPVTTAMFKRSCTPITSATPHDSRQPNLSFAFRPILNSKNISTKYAQSKITQPKKPNSSPIMEKIKSLSANGKKRYFCLL